MIAIPLLFALLVNPPQEPPDRWFAEDKLRHFFGSFIATSFSATAARLAGLDRQRSIAVGVGAGAAAGALKEVHDARVGAGASLRDVVWDLAGIGSAYLVLDSAR